MRMSKNQLMKLNKYRDPEASHTKNASYIIYQDNEMLYKWNYEKNTYQQKNKYDDDDFGIEITFENE